MSRVIEEVLLGHKISQETKDSLLLAKDMELISKLEACVYPKDNDRDNP
ncbi:MAG: hypothetical protein ACRC80_31275 [Waterburya sp.]